MEPGVARPTLEKVRSSRSVMLHSTAVPAPGLGAQLEHDRPAGERRLHPSEAASNWPGSMLLVLASCTSGPHAGVLSPELTSVDTGASRPSSLVSVLCEKTMTPLSSL